MSRASTFHTFVGNVIMRTAKAVLFQANSWHCPCWLPMSQITVTPVDDEEVIVTASDWICGQKGVSEFTETECPKEDENE